ncbi:hypothetical protein DPMN_157937 [Dreissena polymorpha]|uniref:Uncharacterized protein n=1 Tax=Dreissena polymorpha TaxID=45954 RepID=A0A9D4IPB4_DREPO|nr:hypothetical protein DPMN_157937 [Dreissena polymorpha]
MAHCTTHVSTWLPGERKHPSVRRYKPNRFPVLLVPYGLITVTIAPLGSVHPVSSTPRKLPGDNPGHSSSGSVLPASSARCDRQVDNHIHPTPESVQPVSSAPCKLSVDGHSVFGSVQPVDSVPCKLPVDNHQHSLPDSIQPVNSPPCKLPTDKRARTPLGCVPMVESVQCRQACDNSKLHVGQHVIDTPTSKTQNFRRTASNNLKI